MADTSEADVQAPRPRQSRQERKAAYETQGPGKLARTPSQIKPARESAVPAREWAILRQHLEARLNMLRAWRFSWFEHWQLLETYILPRRGIFINPAQPTPNTMIRGVTINQNIVDPTGTYAMRRCAAGMMSGLMSPSRPWFKLKPALFAREMVAPDAIEWFEEVEDRMYTVMGRSNFYDAAAQRFEDLVTFGTGPTIIYEDDADLIRCYVPCPGEYFLGSSSTMRVEPFYRMFVATVSQIVEMFGLENCPPDVRQAWREKGGQLEMERLVAHAIEPNFAVDSATMGDVGVVAGDFAWREVYWLWGTAAQYPLSMRGFLDQPYIAPRWATTSNDPYGRSVGMDVLPDIMQLNQETKRKAEAIEKLVRPPLLASMELKNEPSSVLPGHLTYVTALGPDKGMRPIYTVNPEIKEMMEDLQGLQKRVQEGFFNDLFLMLEESGQQQKTAYEIAQRNQERLQVLGPVIERWQNEDGAQCIKRVFRIMERKRLLPPLPKSLQGVPLGVEFIGMLALAQKAAKTANMERFAATMGNLQAADPTMADIWDREEWAREYADDLFISKRILRSPEMVAALREQRAKQMQAQQMTQDAMTAVQGAETLSKVDVGGGQNAVSAMLGRGGAGTA